MSWYVDIWGYFGGIFACVRFAPQIYKAHNSKSTKDLSWGLLILSICSQTCTITYAILINSKPIFIPVSCALCFTLMLSKLKYKYDKLI